MPYNTIPALPQKPGMVVESAQMRFTVPSQSDTTQVLLKYYLAPERNNSLYFHEFAHSSLTPNTAQWLGVPSIGAPVIPGRALHIGVDQSQFAGILSGLNLVNPFAAPGASTDSLDKQVKAVMTEYTQFYIELANRYEQALRQHGKSTDKKLAYARGKGLASLVEISNQISVNTPEQLTQVHKVLTGYRQIAGSTTEVHGIGSLLIKFVEDLIRRLDRLQLIQAQPQPSLTIESVSHNADAHERPIAA